MDQKDAIHRLVGKGERVLVGQADPAPALLGPADHALHRRREGKDSLRFVVEDAEEGRSVAQTHDSHPGDVGPPGTDTGQHQPAGDLPEAAVVEGVEIGDVLIHALNRERLRIEA